MTTTNTISYRYEPIAYAALRIVAGFLFLLHGVSKLFGWLGPKIAFDAAPQIFIGGIIELVAGALIMIGLFTRAAAFIASGTMAVAYIQFHWKLAFADWAFLPMVNQGELSVIYCFLFLYIAARGAGIASVDAARAR